jgi:nucleotide-binding universal stress UspA family protein
MTRILAIDDPRMSDSLLSAIRHWCGLTGGTARILSVVDESVVRDTTRAIGVVGKVSSAVKEDFIKEKEKVITALLFNAGFTPEDGISVRAGNLLEEIRREIDLYKPDLVITTSRLRGGVINVTEGVLEYTKGNVLILIAPYRRNNIKYALVAMDSDAQDHRAFDTAVSLLRRFGGRVHLVVAVEVNEQILINAPEIIEEKYENAKRLITTLVEAGQGKGIDMEKTIKEGTLAEVVSRVDVNTQPDLILIGGDSSTGISRLIMGSEAGSLLRKVHSPVLVCKKRLPL